MKHRRFSDRQLYDLRNHLPIARVIERILQMDSKRSQGAFRFRCPLCGQFNTAINPPTNLARCFACETNFNPIDMVMAVKKTPFVEAVTFLINHKATTSRGQEQGPERDRPVHRLHQAGSALHRSNNQPVAIANVISSLMEKQQPPVAESCQTDSPHQNTSLSHRISKLQQDVRLLSEQIDQLKSIVCNQK